MINGKSVVALIPARGGSKSIKNKNIKLLGGRPLIAWSIEIALKCPEIDKVIVSTDSLLIKSVAEEYGAEVYDRPVELAQDESLIIDTIRQVIRVLRDKKENADILMLLEPTSPFRDEEDIRNCLKKLTSSDELDSTATFKTAELNPNRAWKIKNGEPSVYIEGAVPWLPRQKLEQAYQLNGAVYAFKIDRLPDSGMSLLFGNMGSLLMPIERSLDIDNELQFELAEIMLRRSRIDE